MILLSLVSLQLFTVQSDEADWLPAHTHTHTVKEKTNWGDVTMARVTTEDFFMLFVSAHCGSRCSTRQRETPIDAG